MPGAPACPDPALRAPRAPQEAGHTRLEVAPASLQGAVLCMIERDLRGLALDDGQRLTHLPVTPFVALACFQGTAAGLVEEGEGGPRWQPFDASPLLAGSQSRPRVCWLPACGRIVLLLFTVEIARELFGIDPAEAHDRFIPARQALATDWWPLLEALQAAPDGAATLAALETHLAPRWRALRGEPAPLDSLRQVGRHWLARLAWQADQWSRNRSPRQVERRIKSASGRSMREWHALLKAEGVFFSARDRYEAGQPLDWADLAQEEGFADQAHLVRAVKRITGFSPTVFTQRYLEDESFWLYRLWV